MVVIAAAVEALAVLILEAIVASVEEGTEAIIVGEISAIFTKEIEATIESKIVEAIQDVTFSTIEEEFFETILQRNLDEAVKDVIGPQGVRDISKTMSATPLAEAIDKLEKAAIDAIDPHLWVFKDPTFFRLTKLVRTLRAIKAGEKPEDVEDDDCEEEMCRYFRGPEMENNLEDFIFFTVFGSEERNDSDAVYSMSAQWKNLKALVDDPIGGNFVTQLFIELFESCEDDVGEEDIDYTSEGVTNVELIKRQRRARTINFVEALVGEMMPLPNKKIYNVGGSSKDKRRRNWLDTYFKTARNITNCTKCYIESAHPHCNHSSPLKGNIVGGHVWSPTLLGDEDSDPYYFILPICRRHNKRNVYDSPNGPGWMITTADAWGMRIKAANEVVEWRKMVRRLKGQQSARPVREVSLSDLGESHEVPRLGGTGECHEIPLPKKLADWLLKEVHKIALEFAKDPIKRISKEISDTVLKKLKGVIKSAGEDAKNWAESEGHDIIFDSLVPICETFQIVKRLSSLKDDAINRFHSEAQSALSRYKNECLGHAEQNRRKERLREETDRVIASKKWVSRVVAFEGTISETVPTLIVI